MFWENNNSVEILLLEYRKVLGLWRMGRSSKI
jgi:hypothetical protein